MASSLILKKLRRYTDIVHTSNPGAMLSGSLAITGVLFKGFRPLLLRSQTLLKRTLVFTGLMHVRMPFKRLSTCYVQRLFLAIQDNFILQTDASDVCLGAIYSKNIARKRKGCSLCFANTDWSCTQILRHWERGTGRCFWHQAFSCLPTRKEIWINNRSQFLAMA